MTSTIHHNKNAGFTLIETLIYIGLFAIIMGGTVISVYYITINTETTQELVLVQEEANFITSKISWALTGATSISVLANPTRLSVNNFGTTLVFTFDSVNGDITLTRGVGSARKLNNDELQITAASFTRTVGPPDKMDVDLTINGQPFELIQYLR